jgi:hypothetical protein
LNDPGGLLVRIAVVVVKTAGGSAVPARYFWAEARLVPAETRARAVFQPSQPARTVVVEG